MGASGSGGWAGIGWRGALATWRCRLADAAAGSAHPSFVDILGDGSWDVPGFRMRSCRGRDQVACTASASGWNGFEPPTPRCFAAAVREAGREAGRGLVIDVGANTGFYTLLALSVCRGMRVAAYEPYAAVRRILAANLALHPHGRDAAVIAAAVSDCGGSRRLYVPAARHGLVETSASLNAAFKSQHASARLVRSCTLDERHLHGPRVAVIKVDAESHDLEVLTGAAAIMLRHRPVIFLEVLLGADAAGLTALLRRCGYLDSVLAADGPTAPDDRVRHDTHAWNHMWIPRETAPG